jgi:hypothetical protein
MDPKHTRRGPCGGEAAKGPFVRAAIRREGAPFRRDQNWTSRRRGERLPVQPLDARILPLGPSREHTHLSL